MILEQHGSEYFHCRIPCIVCARDGSFIVCYECRKSDSDWSEIDIKVRKSTDNGRTWKTVKLIHGDGNTLNNPILLVSDRLHLLYCENYNCVFHSVSDDGENWSEPIEITRIFKDIPHTVVALGPGHGITANDGTLLIPVWFADNKKDPKAHAPSFIATIYSKDNGKTWNTGEIIKADELKNPSECALGLLNDGSVLISVRNENGQKCRFFARSKNGYSDWIISGFDQRFCDPVCQGSMANSGKTLFHINCDSKTERKNLTVKISDDGFRTFKKIKIDDCGGYSDICVKDGRAYIIYEDTTDNENEYYVDMKFSSVSIS